MAVNLHARWALARLAAHRRWHPGDDLDALTEECYREIERSNSDAAIHELVALAGPLTAEQGAYLRRLVNSPYPAPPPAARDRPSVVYYAKRGDLIKIGTSYQHLTRMQQLKAVLLATEPGGHDVEARRHRQFAASRVHGEWFQSNEDLLEHIAGLQGLPC